MDEEDETAFRVSETSAEREESSTLQEWFEGRLEGVWKKKKMMMGGQGILTVLVEIETGDRTRRSERVRTRI